MPLGHTDTSSPPGNEIRAVEYLKQVLDAEGIPSQIFAKDPQRPNLVARIKGNPDFGNVTVKVFDVREGQSRITRAPLAGLLTAAAI